jgi:diacylglycerol O-acyltransferase
VAVGVLSYAGQLNVSVIADADAVPDLGAFMAGLSEALAALGAASDMP